MYLLDTNVLSELRKIDAGKADGNVALWATRTSVLDYWVSVATIFELKRGILLLERKDRSQAALLQRWFDEDVLLEFEERILPVSLPIAQQCAELHVPDPRPDIDGLLAATALVHELTVVTRNVEHFEGMGVRLLNPWLPTSF